MLYFNNLFFTMLIFVLCIVLYTCHTYITDTHALHVQRSAPSFLVWIYDTFFLRNRKAYNRNTNPSHQFLLFFQFRTERIMQPYKIAERMITYILQMQHNTPEQIFLKLTFIIQNFNNNLFQTKIVRTSPFGRTNIRGATNTCHTI